MDKKKIMNKSNNDYVGSIIKAFLLFFSLFICIAYASHCLCVHLSVLQNLLNAGPIVKFAEHKPPT